MNPRITIDYLVPLNVDETSFNNELFTLQDMSIGLYALYTEVKRLESKFPRGKKIMLFGSSPYHSDEELSLLTNYFHWFGISVNNFARLVGYIGGIAQGVYQRTAIADSSRYIDIKKHVDTYVDGIPELSAVKKWRNKVAAHFAITDPRKNSDTASILAYSVMSPVQYTSGHFQAGVGDIQFTHHGGGEELSVVVPQWSVVEVFENLAPRFWPNFVSNPPAVSPE